MTRRVVASTLAIIMALGAAFYFAVWSPDASKLKAAHGRQSSAQAAQLPLRGQISSLAKVHAQLPTLRRDLAQLQQALPSSPQLAATIDQLNATAKRAGVTLESLAPAAAAATASSSANSTSTNGLNTISLSISVQGTYYQVMNYLYYLSKMSRLITVDTVNLGSSGGSHGALTAQLSARMFYVTAAAPSTGASSS